MKILLLIIIFMMNQSLHVMAQKKDYSVNEVFGWLVNSSEKIKNQNFDDAEVLIQKAEESSALKLLSEIFVSFA